jgi:tetratricopeptide (TPR) repeat protein
MPTKLSFTAVLILILIFGALSNCFPQDDDRTGEAIALFNQGQDAHESGDLKRAVEFYEKALEILPEFPEAELQRGNALLALGRKTDAERSFRRAIDLRDDWSLALAALGSLMVKDGRIKDAEPILRRALELDDQNFPALNAMTDLRLRSKAQPDELKRLLFQLTALTGKANPPASIWASRGAVERALGDALSARTSLTKAITLEPGIPYALAELAELAIAAHDPSSADEFVGRLEKIEPDAALTKTLRARVMVEQGHVDRAIAYLDSMRPPLAEVVAFRDKLMSAKTKNPADLERRLEANPKDPIVLGGLCNAYRRIDPVRALDFCRRAFDAEPENISHAVGYGAALVQAKRNDEAVALLRRLLSIAPENATVRSNLATALFQLKRFAEAKAEFRWLVERQPSLEAAYYFLAITHDELEEYPDAMANYQQFLKLADPEKNRLEIEKVNLRLPTLRRQIDSKKGKRG